MSFKLLLEGLKNWPKSDSVIFERPQKLEKSERGKQTNLELGGKAFK